MNSSLLKGVEIAHRERSDLILFALTGRTGSGCSTAAEILCGEFQDIAISEEGMEDPERRKLRICKDFAAKQWVPFKLITVSAVIFTFLLEKKGEEVAKFLSEKKVSPTQSESVIALLNTIQKSQEFRGFQSGLIANGQYKEVWKYFSGGLSVAAQEMRKVLGSNYQVVFQSFGDNVRYSGDVLDKTIDPSKLFSLMERVRTLVRAAEVFAAEEGRSGARVVIDAVRNPLELVYLRDHFSSIYVVAITVDDETRKARLSDIGLRKADIERIDAKEYGDRKHLEDYSTFVSQSLMECIQKADIFVENPGRPIDRTTSIRSLNKQLVRYVALAIRPGLITPTRDERCMQAAFVAKLNSGCISRQVGAAVADAGYSILAMGWNDVPKGQVPCLLRDVDSLLGGQDDVAFSDFEKKDEKLRAHLTKEFVGRKTLKEQAGLPCPYCFKDAYNAIKKDRNQVHTRSLHAEENAFLQLARRGGGLNGGVLYTTASPCELCSKKAFQLGIREIIFVDPYPGISARHILAAGIEAARPMLRLFSGAVGHAYHRLYEATLPIKDEYKVRLGGKVQQELPLENRTS